MNNVFLLGKYYDVYKVSDNHFSLVIIVNGKEKISVQICTHMAASILKFCQKGDLIGIKCKIENHNNRIRIITLKISFLSKNAI